MLQSRGELRRFDSSSDASNPHGLTRARLLRPSKVCEFPATSSLESRARLRRAETVWVESRLRGANLTNARLAGADLRGADLGEPGLDQAGYLRGAGISPAQAGAILASLGITVME